MKKTLLLIIVCLMLLTFIGCTATDIDTSNPVKSTTQTPLNEEVTAINIEDYVDNELLPVLKTLPEGDLVEEALIPVREMMEATPSIPYENIEIEDRTIPGYKDGGNVEIRIYKPKTAKESSEVVIFFHDGGYVLGSIKSSDNYAKNIANSTNLPVVSVDYSLAPEAKYPDALYDSFAALNYVYDNANELNVDKDKIITYGVSAGAGLCASLNLYTRDNNGPKPMLQILLQPMLDYRNITKSSYEVQDTRIWGRSKNIFAWNAYLGDLINGEVPYTASPSLCDDLSNLPSTYITVGSVEVFRDEVIEYTQKLNAANIPVEFHLYNGGFHGFEFFAPQATISQNSTNDVFEYINNFIK